ncbi:gamma-glutamylcyclotransferase [Aliiglaciecola litoralis]|uniref:glutathione-specific gamma-glutamylcyclotransferase n=1 Tax=Aliiglaciecola litoralis TaxID=582857 RepID=A0ABP3WQZ1_9ALTE
MSLNTIEQNRTRQSLTDYDEIWLFGYGSLIYKVDFPFIEKVSASIKGWQRRLWQGSHDHRGTPDNPGRVATLIPAGKATCVGIAFRVTHEVFDHLDHREKNGYLRHEVDIFFNGSSLVKKGLVYIASQDNKAFLGHLHDKELAEHIHRSSGPSGENRDYVFQLADALRAMNVVDEHVFAIEQQLKNM